MSFVPADVLDFMRLYVVAGAGFVVCAVLLITLKKKTAPYIGAMVSLAVLLLGNIFYRDDTYRFWGVLFIYFGKPRASIYIAILLSAAAVTLYWRTHRKSRGV